MAAEPSMEEILSSIREAINDQVPLAPAPTVDRASPEPESSAGAVSSSPPLGWNLDSANHGSHDPLFELTRKLNETRQAIQKQMQQASTSTISTQGQPETRPTEPPPPASAPLRATQPVSPEPRVMSSKESIQRSRDEYAKVLSNLSKRSIARPQPASPRVSTTQPLPPPQSSDFTRPPAATAKRPPDTTFLSGATASSAPSDDKAMLTALMRQIVEPAVIAWLDENLSGIVTKIVHDEVQRMALKLK